MSSNLKGLVLCTVDDICLREFLDPLLGYTTHKSGVTPVNICSVAHKKLLKFQQEKYQVSVGPNSRFAYKPCERYPRDEDFGVKIVATKIIYKDNQMTELYGSLAPVTNSFFSGQVKDYSVVRSQTTGQIKLWLGPAAFLNHDCEANTDIFCLGGDGAIVKANRKIKPGEEITVNYGPHYFGRDNEECMCHSCEMKHMGHYQESAQGAGCIMLRDDWSQDDSNNVPCREDVFTCNMCGQIFLYKSWLSRHIASHMQPIHACEDCERVFNRKDTLKRHIQTVHNKVKHSCDICNAKFSTTHAKTRHINRIHSEENTTVHCPKCPSTFTCQLDLQYHDNLMHTHLKPYKCKDCNQGFETPYILHMHRKSHDGQRNDR